MPAMGFPSMSGSSRASRIATRDGSSVAEPPAPDWPKQATQQIVTVVDSVRDATTGRALTAARFVVYGTVLALLGIPLLVFGLAMVMRLLEHALLKLAEWQQWRWLTDPMWIVYLVFGSIFLFTGLYFWRSANRAAPVPPS
jgi:hypothetical protein